MKVFLDECVPAQLQRQLPHDCATAKKMGWAGLKNGDLRRRIEAAFDVFLTADQSVQYQQRLVGRKLATLVISTNDRDRVLAAVTLISDSLATLQPGEFRELEIP
jgi:hypothetical protein